MFLDDYFLLRILLSYVVLLLGLEFCIVIVFKSFELLFGLVLFNKFIMFLWFELFGIWLVEFICLCIVIFCDICMFWCIIIWWDCGIMGWDCIDVICIGLDGGFCILGMFDFFMLFWFVYWYCIMLIWVICVMLGGICCCGICWFIIGFG